ALASDPEAQLRLFPDFVDKPYELVDDFDNWFRATVWRSSLGISSAQMAKLRDLSNAVAALPGTEFSDDAVRHSALWEQLRRLAREASQHCGWSNELPPPDRSVYVQGSG